jgi:hypothetical protein
LLKNLFRSKQDKKLYMGLKRNTDKEREYGDKKFREC